MRDPKRIDTVLEELSKVWKQVPDWRLGQLISNLARQSGLSDPFFLEDDVLLRQLKGDGNECRTEK